MFNGVTFENYYYNYYYYWNYNLTDSSSYALLFDSMIQKPIAMNNPKKHGTVVVVGLVVLRT